MAVDGYGHRHSMAFNFFLWLRDCQYSAFFFNSEEILVKQLIYVRLFASF